MLRGSEERDTSCVGCELGIIFPKRNKRCNQFSCTDAIPPHCLDIRAYYINSVRLRDASTCEGTAAVVKRLTNSDLLKKPQQCQTGSRIYRRGHTEIGISWMASYALVRGRASVAALVRPRTPATAVSTIWRDKARPHSTAQPGETRCFCWGTPVANDFNYVLRVGMPYTKCLREQQQRTNTTLSTELLHTAYRLPSIWS